MNDERDARFSIDYWLVAALLAAGTLPIFLFDSGERLLPMLVSVAFALAFILSRSRRPTDDKTGSIATISEKEIVPIEQDPEDVARYANFFETETQEEHFAVAANADYAGDERRQDGRPWSPPDEDVREDQIDDISASNDDGWTEL